MMQNLNDIMRSCDLSRMVNLYGSGLVTDSIQFICMALNSAIAMVYHEHLFLFSAQHPFHSQGEWT